MSIICKWIINGEEQIVNFNTIDDMIKYPKYDEFIFINLNKCHISSLPNLPPNLQILSFNDNKIFNLPDIPKTIHSIFGVNNRISKFPEINHCSELEDINLSGNDIEELNTSIPHTVKTIDLDFNRLRKINYELISPDTKLSVAYNFITQQPPQTHINNVKCDHNDIPDGIYRVNVEPADIQQIPVHQRLNINYQPYNYIQPPIRYIRPITNKIHGTDAQNVHNSSIQMSANKSLDYVLSYKPKTEIPYNLDEIILNEYNNNKINKSFIRKQLNKLSNKFAKVGLKSAPPIKYWMNANDIHSQFGVTYKTLIKQVWAIIQDHEHKDAIKEVLFQELDDSINVCFTGRFTRALNSLTGFIEQVQIGLSSGEQMQNQITMAIKNCKKKFSKEEFQEEARKEVKKILDEFEISQFEQEAWLDAIE
jgi:hypothetical protein